MREFKFYKTHTLTSPTIIITNLDVAKIVR